MTREQCKNFLLCFDEGKVVAWYNNCVVDPFGDYSYCIVRPMDEILGILDDIGIAEVIELASSTATLFSPKDKYVVFWEDRIISFTTIEGLLDTALGECIVDAFLEDERENRDYLFDID